MFVRKRYVLNQWLLGGRGSRPEPGTRARLCLRWWPAAQEERHQVWMRDRGGRDVWTGQRERYLRLVEVFDTNTVHDSAKRPGSLCLRGKYDDQNTSRLQSRGKTKPPEWVCYLLLCSDKLFFLQLSVCQGDNHTGRTWETKSNHNQPEFQPLLSSKFVNVYFSPKFSW